MGKEGVEMKRFTEKKIQATMKSFSHLKQFANATLEEIRESAIASLERRFIKKRVRIVKEGQIQCPVCKSKFNLQKIEERKDIIYGKE